MTKKKITIGLAILATLVLGYFITTNIQIQQLPEGDREAFDQINTVVALYDNLKDGNETAVEMPPISYVNIYLVPNNVRAKVAGNTEENIPADEEFGAKVSSFVNGLQELHPGSAELVFETKQNAYFNDTSFVPADSDLQDFFEYNIENGFQVHSIIRVPAVQFDAAPVDQLEGADRIIGATAHVTDKTWENIENQQTFAINSDTVGSIYTLPDSYGYSRAARVDIFKFSINNNIEQILSSEFNLSSIPEEDLEFELINLQTEIINDGEGIIF